MRTTRPKLVAEMQAIEPDAMERARLADAEMAMRTLAALMGDADATKDYLEDVEGLSVEIVELEAMRSGEHRALYQKFADEMAPHLEEALVREMREVAGRSLALERRLLGKIEHDLAAGAVSDPAKALSAVSKTKQIAVDKMLSLTGRPTVITSTPDVAEMVRRLEAFKVLIPIEASTEEA